MSSDENKYQIKMDDILDANELMYELFDIVVNKISDYPKQTRFVVCAQLFGAFLLYLPESEEDIKIFNKILVKTIRHVEEFMIKNCEE